MGKESPNVILQFVRHGDPDRSDKNKKADEYPLLPESEKNLLTVKKALAINDKTAVGFSGNNKRSIDTTHILVSSEGQKELNGLETKYKVSVVKDLLYKMDANFKAFKDSLGLGEDKKSLFRVVVEKSDAFKEESGYNFTAYGDMCTTVADYMLKYIEVLKKWEEVNFKYETESLFRVFCTNEYFYPSFRSKVEEIINGKEAKEKYISWYEKNFERNEERKHEEQSVAISRDSNGALKILLRDPYGQVSLSLEQLLDIKNSILK